ncbi:MAG: glycoside hydrolase family 130 protein [Phycisphaeraceae bacterium]|nr:glycoside hydrolase family 130 protein [Phycisphaeraceae bacterium]
MMPQPNITRCPNNPILTAKEVPYPSTLVFNAGVTRYRGQYVMVFRNDYGNYRGTYHFDGTNLGLATSGDGIHWRVAPQPCWEWQDEEVQRVYDPRLTVLDDRCYLSFAVDTRHGIRAGLAITEDFKHFEVLSLSAPDNRNTVLFPQKINGQFVRLERPFPVYSLGAGEHFDIWLSTSPDGRHWGNTRLVLPHERVPFANAKIGPGAPPLRTKRGWLTLFHAVDINPNRPLNGWEPSPWTKRYTIGLMLLDLNEPWRVIGLCPQPLMVPEAPYELDGFRGGVLFPGGFLDEPDGTVKIYYGAADTVQALATADLHELLNLCQPVG